MATTFVGEEQIERRDGASVRRVIEQSIPNGETGAAILLARDAFAVSVLPGTSGKVQFTCSLPSKVLAGTARWFDWAAGSVTAQTGASVTGAFTAVRGVSTVGVLALELVQ